MHLSSRRPVVDQLECRKLFAAVTTDIGPQPTGPLTGKIVYTSGGHGFVANSSGVWSTQRGLTYGMNEDMGNVDQLTYYADELFRAGATVVPMRPIGHQTNEVIVDNLQATFTSGWSDTTNTSLPYYSTTAGSGVRYRFTSAAATETQTATFRPTLPEGGYYPVYTWVPSSTDRLADQTYRINHAGGATEVKVNHMRVGKGWVYLGTYLFNQGTAGNVQISNKTGGATAGKSVVADAIRFGNGMGTVARNGKTSGQPRENESALYWIEASAGWTSPGVRQSSTNWRTSTTSTDDDANVSAPLRWAAQMNTPSAGKTNSVGESVYISFHSNAGGGRGADGLYNTTASGATPNQLALARYLGKEITNDMVALGSPPLEHAFAYSADPVYAASFTYGELNGGAIADEFDATIIEVAFHDNEMDANIMTSPLGRQKIAQSTAQGTIRYFNQFGGSPLAFLPDAPTDVAAVGNASEGSVTVSWKAPATSSIYGGAPTGYRVYASRDGYSFDGGQYVAGASTTSLKIAASKLGTGPVYFKVVAVNAGGESLASGVVAARAGDANYGRVLIVNGFDRLDRLQGDVDMLPLTGTNNTTAGNRVAVARVRQRAGNSYDYAVQHAQAIASAGYSLGFDTADNEAILSGKVNLASYHAVIWISGEESTADKTFSTAEQSLVKNYLANGGKFMASGSEIGYDLVSKGNGASFFNSTLKSGYVGDDANTYAAVGTSGSIFAGLSLAFDNGTGSTYHVDYPDRLSTANGGTSVLTYSGGTGGVAATTYSAGSDRTKVKTLVMGFGFETILDGATRNALMQRTLAFFGLNLKLSAGGAMLAYATDSSAEMPVGGFTAAFLTTSTRGGTTLTTTTRATTTTTTLATTTVTTTRRDTTTSIVQQIGLS